MDKISHIWIAGWNNNNNNDMTIDVKVISPTQTRVEAWTNRLMMMRNIISAGMWYECYKLAISINNITVGMNIQKLVRTSKQRTRTNAGMNNRLIERKFIFKRLENKWSKR